MFTRPIMHTQTGYVQPAVHREPSPVFSLPVAAWTREPGTNYYTIITAEGPQSIVVGMPYQVPTYFQPG